MHFYLDGYNPGDPDILTAELPDAVDVLIVGSGPAGALLAAQLSTFPSISTRLVERRDGPLQVGQADGVACRTVEMFDTFGLSGKLLREAYWVNETVFWRPSKADRSRIERTGRVQDTEDGLSEFPHLIVNQARMQKYLLDYMRNSPTRLEANYGLEFLDLNVETEGEHPVVVTLRKVANGAESTVRAKYVVGCDGARSRVRDSIGAVPRGDFANHAWGVVDMLAVTDFPDIRLKAAIQSADEGRAKTELLRTYTVERHAIAQGLIDFDKEWSKIMASPPKDPNRPELGGLDPAELQAYFVKSGRYTAGVATHYPPATVLTAEATHQNLAKGFTIGMRFHSAPVVRLADAKPVHLGHAARADGAWRIYAFADASGQCLRKLADFLAESPNSPIRRFTPAGANIDSVIDVRAVFQQGHRDLKVEELPSILLPRKGRFGLIDYEKAYCPDLKNGPNIFELRGIDREKGAIVVGRPDQYVSNVLPLDAHDELTAYFGRFLLDRQ